VASAYADPPGRDELEVTIFGRGKGESILCHLGDARWLMVDSFKTPDGVPVADDYLSQLSGDHRITAVVATHWDTDHTHGMAAVIENHAPEEVWMPAVLDNNEAFRFAQAHDAAVGDGAPSGLRDFVEVAEMTADNNMRRWGVAGRHVHTATATEVSLLAPVDGVVSRGFAALGIARHPGFGEISSLSANETSIVLLVARGCRAALLGGDLVAGALGWTAVIDGSFPEQQPSPRGIRRLSRPTRPSYFKVPHHGSRDGDDERVWSDVLGPRPVQTAARFTGLRRPLPKPDDVRRIVDRSSPLHVVGPLPPRLEPESDAFDLHLDAATVDGLRPVSGLVGTVRARAKWRGWSVQSFGPVEIAEAA
jgi:Metallo-beta-lactamase superfamily